MYGTGYLISHRPSFSYFFLSTPCPGYPLPGHFFYAILRGKKGAKYDGM